MKRFILSLYGSLAASCWLICIWIMIQKPFLNATNNRALIAFTIIGSLFTFIWLTIIRPTFTRKPLSNGKH